MLHFVVLFQHSIKSDLDIFECGFLCKKIILRGFSSMMFFALMRIVRVIRNIVFMLFFFSIRCIYLFHVYFILMNLIFSVVKFNFRLMIFNIIQTKINFRQIIFNLYKWYLFLDFRKLISACRSTMIGTVNDQGWLVMKSCDFHVSTRTILKNYQYKFNKIPKKK